MIFCVLCFLLCMFLHFMPFIVYFCTTLLSLGVIKDNNNKNNFNFTLPLMLLLVIMMIINDKNTQMCAFL